MSKEACYLCGRDPAAGYAAIYKDGQDKRYCHGDDDDMSCYETRVIENAPKEDQ